MRSKLLVFLIAGLLHCFSGCAPIQKYRNIEQPTDSVLSTTVGGTIFRLNKTGDLPNCLGRADIWGGKVNRGFAELRLKRINKDGSLTLLITEIERQSTETTMDRYKPFKQQSQVNVDVKTNIHIGDGTTPNSYEMEFDPRKQRDLVVSSVKVTFLDVQPYSILYKLMDIY